MNKLILIAALGAVAHATAAPALAPAEKRVAIVDAAGLNLATQRGVQSLDRRIRHAAAELCGSPSAADPRGRRDVSSCIDEAVAGAAAARSRAIALGQSGRPVLASGQ